MPLGDFGGGNNVFDPNKINSWSNLGANTGVTTFDPFNGSANSLAGGNGGPGQGGIAGAAVTQTPATTLTPDQMQQLAQGLGLIGAQYNNDTGDLSKMYDINSRQNSLAGQLIGLNNSDIQSQMRDVGNDNVYRDKMIASIQGQIGSFNADRGLYQQQLQNQLAGFGQDRRMADFNTANKYISGGGYFSPGQAVNLENNAFEQSNKSQAATLQNQLTNSSTDRSIANLDQQIFGQENQKNQNTEQMSRLNNSLAKNGIQLKQNDLSMEQLKQEFDQRMKQSGITRAIDTNKLFNDLLNGNSAAANQLFKSVFPDLVVQ